MARSVYILDRLVCFSKASNPDLLISQKEDLKIIADKIKARKLEYDIRISGYGVKKMFKHFRKNFKYIKAAGGIVQNSKGEFLLIKRNGCWELPKGKLDSGETLKEAAIREVQEETGLMNISVTGKLKSTYHIFSRRKVWCLKRTYWYQMNHSGNELPVPELEEGITKAKWMSKSEAARKIAGSYRSISENFSQYFA